MVGKEVEIISVLGSSQGVISVVAALLAGASGTMLTCVSEEAMLRAGFISYLFLLSGTLGTALNLGTAVICIVAEQESKVAYAFSMLYESEEYDKNLEEWWRDFAVLRTRALLCFMYSVPLSFFTMACQCYIAYTGAMGIVGFIVFNSVGGTVFYYLLKINELFRRRVLNIKGHHAPIYDSKSKRVLGAASDKDIKLLESEKQVSTPKKPEKMSADELHSSTPEVSSILNRRVTRSAQKAARKNQSSAPLLLG